VKVTRHGISSSLVDILSPPPTVEWCRIGPPSVNTLYNGHWALRFGLSFYFYSSLCFFFFLRSMRGSLPHFSFFAFFFFCGSLLSPLPPHSLVGCAHPPLRTDPFLMVTLQPLFPSSFAALPFLHFRFFLGRRLSNVSPQF